MKLTNDPRQTDLFSILSVVPALAPPPLFQRETLAAVARTHAATDPIHSSDGRAYWRTRAFQWSGEILASPGRPQPIELLVRGIPTVVSFGMGFATHAIDRPGTPYWSETGFRSFTGCAETNTDTVRAVIEAYIDGPVKDGNGCGGSLSPWWTHSVRQLQQHRGWIARCSDDPDERVIAREAELIEQVRGEGFDPEIVAPSPKRRVRAAA